LTVTVRASASFSLDLISLETDDLVPQDVAKLLQRAITDGNPWEMQGSYGRSMMEAVERGECMLGEQPASNAYGGRIPARSDI